MTVFIIKKTAELSPENSTFSLQGFSGAASANSTTNIDYLISTERWLTGGVLLVNNGNWGDSLHIQVIDKDNVLGYGSNVVLQQFITNFYVRPDSVFQEKLEVPYVSLLVAGLYVRIVYTNTSLFEVGVACNLYLHKPKM